MQYSQPAPESRNSLAEPNASARMPNDRMSLQVEFRIDASSSTTETSGSFALTSPSSTRSNYHLKGRKFYRTLVQAERDFGPEFLLKLVVHSNKIGD